MCLAIFQAIAEKPEDAEKVRSVLAKNIITQLRAPGVAPEVVQSVMRPLRELGRSEFQSMIRERLISSPKK
jgi:hypothetical protein